ncbi:MAG: LysR family transcriptional regulator [Acetobacteraceae bacterium]
MTIPSPASLVGLRAGPLLEAYRIFAEVAACRSMSQASWNLDLDVSVVSRQIAAIERAFDCTLFERHRRGVRLTEAGARVAEHVTQLLAQETRLREELGDLRQLRLGSVRIAATDGAIAGPLSHAITTFARLYPGVQVELFRASSEQVVPILHRGHAELGAGLDVGAEPGIEIVASYEDILAAAVAPGHALARRPFVTIEDLHGYAVGTFERNSGVGRTLQRLAARGAPTIQPTLVTNSLHALRMLAECGAGVALICPHSVEDELRQNRLVAVPVHAEGPVPIVLNICVLQGRRRSFAVDRFIEELVGGGGLSHA